MVILTFTRPPTQELETNFVGHPVELMPKKKKLANILTSNYMIVMSL
jgi:hypothetical protein